jgi:hypothetical protein
LNHIGRFCFNAFDPNHDFQIGPSFQAVPATDHQRHRGTPGNPDHVILIRRAKSAKDS